MKWKKQIPDKPGIWLRATPGPHVQSHRFWIEKDIPGFRGKLVTVWGWGGEQGYVEAEKIKHKLGYFWWIGPIPEPPLEAYPPFTGQ